MQAFLVSGLHNIGCLFHVIQEFLEVSINVVKSLGIFRKLVTDIFRSNEDALQMRPCSLYFKPDGDDRICSRKLLLPSRDFLKEVGNVFGSYQVLQLDLNELFENKIAGIFNYLDHTWAMLTKIILFSIFFKDRCISTYKIRIMD